MEVESMKRYLVVLTVIVVSMSQGGGEKFGEAAQPQAAAKKPYDPTAAALADIAKRAVGKRDWPQWGGWDGKNNTPAGTNIPIDWDVSTGKNIKWQARLGSVTHGSPVVANGHVYVGTNNGAGYLKRFPPKVDLGCLLCFDERTGGFLWQHSTPKIQAGRVNDWPQQGICSSPYVDGDRLWYVTSRSEVVCLDTEGFHDGKNDGPFRDEPNENRDEADVVWKYDMMSRLRTFPHNMSNCSVVCVGNILLVNSSNGVDATHINIPAPNGASLFALDRRTGELLWQDKSPGANLLHGQWSNPAVITVNGKPQVLFGAGDGWLRSFDPAGNGRGGSKVLWKFDCNPKDSRWVPGGQGARNNIIATPVVYDGLVYLAVGQDPEHGQGMGHLYCIKPPAYRDGTDVSRELAIDAQGKLLPQRRLRAIDPQRGERAIPNPKSAMVWHFGSWTPAAFAAKRFGERFHRSISNATIKNGILVIADFSGLLHCIDAKTGRQHWSYDMFAQPWGTPLIVEDKIYVGDDDGDIAIFPLTVNANSAVHVVKGLKVPALGEIKMLNAVYTTPVVANDVLFIANKNTLYAISAGGK